MVNVYGFGAAGDGTTDDTDALQHALNDGDGILRLNKGTYRITRPLVIDLTKRGYGAVRGEAGTSRIIMTGAGPAIRVVGDHQGSAKPSSYKDHTWSLERFPTISGVEILGEHPEAVGIELRKTTKCVISQVLVRRCKYGVHLVERNRDFILADAHIYDNHEIGVFFDRCNLHQAIIHGCHISWNKYAGIKSLGGDLHNFQIVGNDIEYNNMTATLKGMPAAEQPDISKHPGGSEILLDAREGIASEVTISGNTIQATVQSGGANIRIIGAEVERPQPADFGAAGKADTAHLINITGNVLGSQGRAVEMLYAARITITGNTIYDSADVSIFGRYSSGIVVGANTITWRGLDTEPTKDGLRFEDCDNVVVSGLATQRLCAGSAESGAAITLLRCRDCSVSDCQILDPLHRGVELDDSIRCRVANNTIVDRRAKPTMRQAVRVAGNSRFNLVTGNIVGGATEAPLDTPQGTAEARDNLILPPEAMTT